jgi:hypothetical protein
VSCVVGSLIVSINDPFRRKNRRASTRGVRG